MSVFAGLLVVCHCPPVQPVVGIPAGVLRSRLRLREGKAARLFLRFADRIEQRFVLVTDAGWSAGPVMATNWADGTKTLCE